MDCNLVMYDANISYYVNTIHQYQNIMLPTVGSCECQVATTPHISHVTSERSTNIQKSFSDPDTLLLGGPEMFVESSSMIFLIGVISWTSSPLSNNAWFHHQTKLTFQGHRPGLSLIFDNSDVTTMSLLLQLARLLGFTHANQTTHKI